MRSDIILRAHKSEYICYADLLFSVFVDLLSDCSVAVVLMRLF